MWYDNAACIRPNIVYIILYIANIDISDDNNATELEEKTVVYMRVLIAEVKVNLGVLVPLAFYSTEGMVFFQF